MRMDMRIRFEHCSFILGQVQRDGGTLYGYRCEKCGELVVEFPATDRMRNDPFMFMYPPKREMADLTAHDTTHKPKPEPVTLEGTLCESGSCSCLALSDGGDGASGTPGT